MSVSTEGGGLPGHSTSQKQWDELGNTQQREVLVGAMQERSLSDDPDTRDWEDYDEPTKSKTLAAIEQSLEDTRTIHAFEGIDDKRTIPVEVYELTGDQEEAIEEHAEVIYRVSQAGEADDVADAEDLREELGEDADDLFDSLEEVEDWLFDFLGEVAEDPALDSDWWRDPSNYPAGLHSEVFSEIFVRRQERQQASQSFREERLGGGTR